MKRFRKILWWSNIVALLAMTTVIAMSFFWGVRFSLTTRKITSIPIGPSNGLMIHTESMLVVRFGSGGMHGSWYPSFFSFESYEPQRKIECRPSIDEYRGYPFQEMSGGSQTKETLVRWLGFQHTHWVTGTHTITLPVGAIIPFWTFFTVMSVRRQWKKYRHDKRVSRGECPICCYVVASHHTGMCPECGSEL